MLSAVTVAAWKLYIFNIMLVMLHHGVAVGFFRGIRISFTFRPGSIKPLEYFIEPCLILILYRVRLLFNAFTTRVASLRLRSFV